MPMQISRIHFLCWKYVWYWVYPRLATQLYRSMHTGLATRIFNVNLFVLPCPIRSISCISYFDAWVLTHTQLNRIYNKINPHAHAHTHKHRHTQTHTHTHKQTHTYTHTNTHTHTHTHGDVDTQKTCLAESRSAGQMITTDGNRSTHDEPHKPVAYHTSWLYI